MENQRILDSTTEAISGAGDIPEDVSEIILEGRLITKEKRHEIYGKVAGGSDSSKPERYQKQVIEKITKEKCLKTHIRINLRTHTLKCIPHPNTKKDGFDYTEDFDGYQCIHSKDIYYYLKCIVGKGGAQTRSLREVYWFIQGQLSYLLHEETNHIYFVNILDGDVCHSYMDKYNYLLTLEEYKDIYTKIYVGDLFGFSKWFQQFIIPES
jgi:hypothetical protein